MRNIPSSEPQENKDTNPNNIGNYHPEKRFFAGLEEISSRNFQSTKERIFELFFHQIAKASYIHFRNIHDTAEEIFQTISPGSRQVEGELARQLLKKELAKHYFDELIQRKVNEFPEQKLVIAKSFTGAIVLKSEDIHTKNWLPGEYLECLDEGKSLYVDKNNSVATIRSIVSLLDTIHTGKISSASEPNNSGSIVDYVGKRSDLRRQFEQSLEDIAGASYSTDLLKICPVYGVIANKDDLQDAYKKLSVAYHDIIYVFPNSSQMNRSVFTPGDSTNGGRLNVETEKIYNESNPENIHEIINNPQQLLGHLDYIRTKYGNVYDFYEDEGVIRFKPKPYAFKEAIMGKNDAIRMNAVIEALKELKLGYSFDYVEVQMIGDLHINSLKEIIINTRIVMIWNRVLEHLKVHDIDLWKKVQTLIKSRTIRVENIP